MTPEDRLRQAMEARASRVEPSADALSRIEEKLMDAQRSDNRKRVLLGLGAAAAVVAIVIGVVVLTDDDDEPVSSDDTTTTTESTTTTSTTESTTTTTDVPGRRSRRAGVPGSDDVAAVRRPDVGGPRVRDRGSGYTRPGASASSSRATPGPARSSSGRFAEGAPSVVLLRQLEDDAWYVIGVSTDSIRLTTPQIGDTLTSPQPLEGQAYAYEGNVQVRLYADGVQEPIGETIVTGRGDGVLGDFTGELEFTNDTGATHGVLVLNGDERRGRRRPVEVSAIRVRL